MFVARRGTANLKMLESSERRSRETPSKGRGRGGGGGGRRRRRRRRRRRGRGLVIVRGEEARGTASCVARRRDAREGDAPSGFRENLWASATDRRLARERDRRRSARRAGDETRRGGAKTRVAQGASAAGEGPIVGEGDAPRVRELSELTQPSSARRFQASLMSKALVVSSTGPIVFDRIGSVGAGSGQTKSSAGSRERFVTTTRRGRDFPLSRRAHRAARARRGPPWRRRPLGGACLRSRLPPQLLDADEALAARWSAARGECGDARASSSSSRARIASATLAAFPRRARRVPDRPVALSADGAIDPVVDLPERVVPPPRASARRVRSAGRLARRESAPLCASSRGSSPPPLRRGRRAATRSRPRPRGAVLPRDAPPREALAACVAASRRGRPAPRRDAPARARRRRPRRAIARRPLDLAEPNARRGRERRAPPFPSPEDPRTSNPPSVIPPPSDAPRRRRPRDAAHARPDRA